MYLTARDRKIIKFIEEYKSITINQCSKIFFNNCKESYYQARKRLKLLADNKYLQRYRKDMRSETVYYITKKLSFHDLKVLDIYTYLISLGANIKTFKREYIITLEDKEYRADGFIECVKDGYFYPILVEIDYTHFTSKKKLMDIYNSGYFQSMYKKLDADVFPTVVIMRPVVVQVDKELPFNLVCIDFPLSNLNSVFEDC